MAATLTIESAKLELQSGFAHISNSEGQPTPGWLLPLTISASSECALLFVVQFQPVAPKDGKLKLILKYFLRIPYEMNTTSIMVVESTSDISI